MGREKPRRVRVPMGITGTLKAFPPRVYRSESQNKRAEALLALFFKLYTVE